MWLVVGVSGVTCGGKTTLARALHAALSDSRLVCQDDFFLPKDSEKHTWIPQLNHINWEIMSALDMDKMWEKIQSILSGTSTKVSTLIIEGFLVLNYSPIAELCHLKYHLTLDREECWARRSIRTYDPPDVPGFFELCVWPEYERHKEDMLQCVSDVRLLDGTENIQSIINTVLKEVKDVAASLEEKLPSTSRE